MCEIKEYIAYVHMISFCSPILPTTQTLTTSFSLFQHLLIPSKANLATNMVAAWWPEMSIDNHKERRPAPPLTTQPTMTRLGCLISPPNACSIFLANYPLLGAGGHLPEPKRRLGGC